MSFDKDKLVFEKNFLEVTEESFWRFTVAIHSDAYKGYGWIEKEIIADDYIVNNENILRWINIHPDTHFYINEEHKNITCSYNKYYVETFGEYKEISLLDALKRFGVYICFRVADIGNEYF